MFRSRAVSLALVGLFLWLTACTSYKQIELAEVADYGKVRVTTTDGECETLHKPWVEGDSIKGDDGPPNYEARAIAQSRAKAVEGGSTNAAGTVFLVLGSILIVAVVVGGAPGYAD